MYTLPTIVSSLRQTTGYFHVWEVLTLDTRDILYIFIQIDFRDLRGIKVIQN
jgi:hypothetical protein